MDEDLMKGPRTLQGIQPAAIGSVAEVVIPANPAHEAAPDAFMVESGRGRW